MILNFLLQLLHEKAIQIIGAIGVVAIIILGITFTYNGLKYSKEEIKLLKSSAGVFCEEQRDSDEYFVPKAGTGMFVSREGAILVPADLIPADDKYVRTRAEGCVVSVLDKHNIFGSKYKHYYATPVVIKD